MKRIRLYSSILIIVIILATGCRIGEQRITEVSPIGNLRQDTLLIDAEKIDVSIEDVHNYDIKVEVDTEKDQLFCAQQVDYINNTQQVLNEVYFNLYPNAFKTPNTAPMLFNNSVDSNNYVGGFLDFNSILIEDQSVSYEILGIGETILKIPLEVPLEIGDRMTIDMIYTVQIPNLRERFGVWDGVYNLGNWYPVAAVFDHKGWNLEPYYSVGDPFYSEVSNYRVTITLPEDMIVASSGNILSHTIIDNKGIWEIEAKLMRDFAWGSSSSFQLEEVMVEDTVVKMYFLTKDATVRKKAKEYTINSLETFNSVFGSYPYGQYSVVETNFPSGMEYPGLVFIGKQYYNKNNLESLELIIVHETAHQWWYGVIGNDQINEAWLDESLATYSEVIYYREVYDDAKGLNHHISRNESSYEVIKDLVKDQRILKSLAEFDGWFDYGNLVYSQGARMLYNLEKDYGKEALYKILTTYYIENQFKVTTTEDFIEVCERVLGVDKQIFFKSWLLGL
ncbi:M1 family metallopeptidase [Alkaliphilus transvaalensis]|uniref:M1 family metallopeptidase n=1 Tax=Alkaliphilus transvaalensis TaxID=114628 RepID=UPI000685F62A|nr:M1 family metallopeptidase [Alkaliphilus transvaalensis]